MPLSSQRNQIIKRVERRDRQCPPIWGSLPCYLRVHLDRGIDVTSHSRKAVHGEPDAWKRARPVRREGRGNLQPKGRKASFLYSTRQMIAERTKDKLSAARKRGKQLGGVPVLGYTIEKEPRRHLVIVPEEAFIVKEIFRLYLEKKSLLEVVRELRNRGWRNKIWKTQAGKLQGGKPFDKNSLSRLLSRHVYIGKVLYEREIYDGEHEAIIEESVFYQVQDVLNENKRTNGAQQRNKYGALLRGILRCGSCGKSIILSTILTKSLNS